MNVPRMRTGVAVVTGLIAVATATVLGQSAKRTAWSDDFTAGALDSRRWVIAAGPAPGHITGSHHGSYEPTNVRVANGFLIIALTQEYGTVDGSPGVISRGGLVQTKTTYGYGTYEWRMRMSSTGSTPTAAGLPVSGTVSAGFTYVNNSQTEVDFESNGADPSSVSMTNWLNTNPRRDPTDSQHTSSAALVPDATAAFKTYKFVWEPGRISYYIDDVLQATHVTNVPRAAAYFMINHWGTDSPWWGGMATVGTTRYFYVDWARFTPAS